MVIWFYNGSLGSGARDQDILIGILIESNGIYDIEQCSGNDPFERQVCRNIWMLWMRISVVSVAMLINDIQLLLIKFKIYF